MLRRKWRLLLWAAVICLAAATAAAVFFWYGKETVVLPQGTLVWEAEADE